MDLFEDRWLTGEPIYVTDLERCTPANRLSMEPELRKWRTVDYATDWLSGTMLMAGPETAAGKVTYPLDASGWRAISIGLMPSCHGGGDHATEVTLRLSDDPVDGMGTLWHAVDDMDLPERGKHLIELFWKIADCTDQQLEIGQVAAKVGSGDDAGTFACSARTRGLRQDHSAHRRRTGDPPGGRATPGHQASLVPQRYPPAALGLEGEYRRRDPSRDRAISQHRLRWYLLGSRAGGPRLAPLEDRAPALARQRAGLRAPQ